jgi:Domain of unknown function (DUF4124)
MSIDEFERIEPVPHAKNTQRRAPLVLRVICFAAFASGNATAYAEMYQCAGSDGGKSFSDQPCPGRAPNNSTDNSAATNAANKAAAIKAAQKAASAAREAVVGKSNTMKSKPSSETANIPTHQPALPLTTKAGAAPTTTQDLEERAIEQAAFSASLFVHVIESLDPACQKMMLDLSELENRDSRSGNGEPSAEQKTMREAWGASCRSKAKAASESYPPPERVSPQSIFGSSPRCMVWVRSLAAKSKLGNSLDVRSTAEVRVEMRRECR